MAGREGHQSGISFWITRILGRRTSQAPLSIVAGQWSTHASAKAWVISSRWECTTTQVIAPTKMLAQP